MQVQKLLVIVLILNLLLLLLSSCSKKTTEPGEPAQNFVLVRGGTFYNGTNDVTISSFYLDKHELTQADYEAVMGTNPATTEYGIGSDHPVYYVSWFNAIEYCNRRSLQEGLTPCYGYSDAGNDPDSWPGDWDMDWANHSKVSCNWAARGYRLPTNMEWMFAAKGGTKTQDYSYSGSNDIDLVAWYSENDDPRGPKSVGTKASNELGLYDMTGNVWEWVWDISDFKAGDAQDNPHGADSGSDRVFRGGSWDTYYEYCRISYWARDSPDLEENDIGFRVARIAP
jgi:formylglycine-generating enzyme required for sulfatase activity